MCQNIPLYPPNARVLKATPLALFGGAGEGQAILEEFVEAARQAAFGKRGTVVFKDETVTATVVSDTPMVSLVVATSQSKDIKVSSVEVGGLTRPFMEELGSGVTPRVSLILGQQSVTIVALPIWEEDGDETRVEFTLCIGEREERLKMELARP